MKKIIAMLLVLSMVLAFAGCAKTETAPETTVAPEDTAPAAAEEGILDGGADIAVEAAPAVMTHEEYIAAELHTPVVIETYVQAHQSWWENKVTVYCQSPDGAYFLYELACSGKTLPSWFPAPRSASPVTRVSGQAKWKSWTAPSSSLRAAIPSLLKLWM